MHKVFAYELERLKKLAGAIDLTKLGARERDFVSSLCAKMERYGENFAIMPRSRKWLEEIAARQKK